MQALVRYGMGENDIRLDDMPEPSPGPRDIKVEVKAAGICGTDMQGHPGVKPPVILGHEFAGVVVAVGSECKTRKVGDRITSETTKDNCGTCRFCRENRTNLCSKRTGLASSGHGCFAKYVIVNESRTHLLPGHVSFEAGSLSEPLACAVHAVTEQANVQPGEFVLVTGPGAIGLLVAKSCVILGARVAVAGTSADAERLKLALGLGVEHIFTVDKDKKPLAESIRDLTGGYGADVAIECAGAEAAFKAALSCLRIRGRLVQEGILHKSLPLDFDDVFFVRELSLIGARTSNPASWQISMKWQAEKKIDLAPLVTSVLPLKDWQKSFGLVRSRKAIKAVLIP